MQLMVFITAAVVIFFLVALLRKNVRVEFWASVGALALTVFSLVYDIFTESGKWYIITDGVLIVAWSWIAYSAYRRLYKGQHRAEGATDE